MPDIFATKNMSKMIIETIERLSIDVFVTAMAITAVVIAHDAPIHSVNILKKDMTTILIC